MGQHLFWVWRAFSELSFRRPYAGMGSPIPIPFSEIEAYARFKGITSLSDRERLFRLLNALDIEWMRQSNEKQELEQARRANTQTPPPSHNPPRGGGRRSPRKRVS